MKTISLSLLCFITFMSTAEAQWRDGTNGWDGSSKTITAGGPFSLNLSGDAGGNGQQGSDGSTGRCNTYTDANGQTVDDNVAGGNGEAGGNGGRGGDGGNLTVYFSDYAQLKDIRFVSEGGDGGYGANGGRGGWGCPTGNDGSTGSRGAYGSSGDLYLVPSELAPLRPDSSSSYVKAQQLLAGVELIKRVWEKVSNQGLLAARSSYGRSYVLKGYDVGSAKIELIDASLIAPNILNESMHVELSKGITTIVPRQFLMVGQHSEPSLHAVLQIERLYLANEFRSIKYKEVMGKTGARKIVLATSANLVPHPQLTMNIKVEVRGSLWRYRTLYTGDVNPGLIHAVNSAYHIDLDRLPLSQRIKRGARIRLTMKYTLKELTIEHENAETWVTNAP